MKKGLAVFCFLLWILAVSATSGEASVTLDPASPRIGDYVEVTVRPDRPGAPLGSAYSAKQHRVAGLAGLRCSIWIGLAEGIDGAASQKHIRIGKAVAELLSDPVQDLYGLVHHLGADAVAPDQCDFKIHTSYLLTPPGPGPSGNSAGRRR